MVIPRIMLALAFVNLAFLIGELAFNVLGQILPALGVGAPH